MTVQSAQSITTLFTTRVFATGVGTNADSTPTGTLYKNGTADGATVTVTNISTGLYKAAVTLPTLAVNDVVSISIAATVSSVTDTAKIWEDSKDQVVDAAGLVDATAVKLGPTGAATAQTARDIGASVLLSSGAGTGQLDFTSGVVKANAVQWLGGTIPAVTVTGVPLVDARYLLGTAFSTPTVAGIPNVNVKTWNDLATVALPLVPTTAGRTLDVSTTGEAGIDWANVGSPTTTLNLSGTTIKTATDVATATTAIQTKTDFLPSATAGSAGGVMIAGSNAATTFASLAITGTTTLTGHVLLSDGMKIAAPSTLDRSGFEIAGNGAGSALKLTGGDTGNGFTSSGGATGGEGFSCTGTGGSAAFDAYSATGNAVSFISAGGGGNGLFVQGTNESAVYFYSPNSYGMQIEGDLAGLFAYGYTGGAIKLNSDTVGGFTDTSAADSSIKGITDKVSGLTFTTAGQVDANIQYVNDIEVQGDGQAATPWNPV